MRYAAVLFDLLTALLDSWSLWDRVAGGPDAGRRWRMRYLQLTYSAGRYRPYEDLVAQAAGDVGLNPLVAEVLLLHWDQLAPWSEAPLVLRSLAEDGPIGVVTNCSEALAQRAVERVGVAFSVVVSAERAGWYKPDPRPYQLALGELGLLPPRVLFVAGSPYDVLGAARVGMPVFWHNRAQLADAAAAAQAVACSTRLEPLCELVSAAQ